MAGDLRERQKAEGKRQNVTVRPSGAWTQSYGYDTARRLQTLTSPAGTFSYTFNGPGNTWTNLALPPTGSHIARGLDNVARLASTELLNSGGGTLNSHAYLYNLASQRTRQTRTDNSYVTCGYDPNGQLRSAVGTWGQSTENLGFRYDGGWNLITRTNNGVPTTFAVDYQNQLTAGPEAPYSYDANGNLIGKGSMTFQYDGENRLITVTQPGVFQSQFAYDAIGRLRIRWESAWAGYYWSGVSTTVYLYDGMQVIQERDNTGTPLVAYTRGSDLGGGLDSAGGIGGLLTRSIGYSGGTWTAHHFYHADAGGNVTYLMDASQNLAASYIHGPFGDIRGTNGPYAADNLYRYSSKHFHTNSALHYFGFRFYDTTSQRWLNRDPIGEKGGINLYRYSRNNPPNDTDPLGLVVVACNPKGKPVNVTVGASDVPQKLGPNDRLPSGANVGQFLENIAGKIHPGECLSRLTIVAHGNPAGIYFSGDSSAPLPLPDPNGRVDGDGTISPNNAKQVGERIKKLCVCSPCTIWALSCHTGLFTIGDGLSAGSGCTVVTPKGFCHPKPYQPWQSGVTATDRHYPNPPAGSSTGWTISPPR